VAAVIGGAWASLVWTVSSIFRPCDFLIHHHPGRPVTVRGRIARSKVPGIAGFFARDLNPGRPVTVRGTWSGRALRLRITGGLSPAMNQQVRNFLLEHLR